MGTEQNRDAALSELLAELFDGDGAGLLRWAHLRLGKKIHDELPASVPLSQLAFDATLAIQRHGLARQALTSLSDERPARTERIQEVARLWGLTIQTRAAPDSTSETLSPAASSQLGPLWEVPELPPHYLARSTDIAQLELALLAPAASAVGITAVGQNSSPAADKHGLYGMGGIGKSVLAAAIARERVIRERFHDGIFWIAVGQTPQLALLQAQLCRALGHAEVFNSISEGTRRLRELATGRAILVILDDVWDAAHAQALDVAGRDGRMLVTTRDLEVLTWLEAREHCLDVLDVSQALALLADWTQITADALPPTAAEVARACGYLPLALAMIGALVRRGRTWAEVQTWLSGAQLVRIQGRVPAYPYRNVLQAVDASVTALAAEHALARQCYLDLAVFPENTPIPRSALRLLWSRHGLPPADADALADTMSDRALARRDEADRVMLHDLQRLYARTQVADLTALHGALTDAYLARRRDATDDRDGRYADLDDGYFFQHLPWHLAEADRHEALAALLFDFDWLDAKLRATSPANLLADFAVLDTGHAAHREAMLVRDAVLLASHVLASDPNQLSSQLVGRLDGFKGEHPNLGPLLGLEKEDEYEHVRSLLGFGLRPRPGSELKYVHLRGLLRLDHARLDQLLVRVRADTRQTWLCPLTPTLTPAGSPLVRTFTGHKGEVTAVAMLPGGKQALSASGDSTLKLWDLDTGAVLRTLDGHSEIVTAVAVLPSGKQALSASSDTTLKLWDLDTGVVLRTLKGHSEMVTAVAVLPSGKQALSASSDKTLKLWDLDTGVVLRTFEGHSDAVTAVALLPGAKHALSASGDKTFKLWDLDTGAVLRTLSGHSRVVSAVVVLPGGKQVLSASWDVFILWDLDTDGGLRRFEGHSHGVRAIALLPGGKHVVSASGDTTLKLWSLDTGTVLRTFEGHSSVVTAVAVLPDGKRVLSASGDTTLKLWDLDTRAVPRTLKGHSDSVTAVAVMPGGKHVLSASGDNTFKLWDLDTGAVLRALDSRWNRVTAIAALPDGKRVLYAFYRPWLEHLYLEPDMVGEATLYGSCLSMLALWDMDNGAVLRTLKGHAALVTAVAVLPGGKHGLSASVDRTLKLWCLDTGVVLRTLEGHLDAVTAVALLPGAKHALSASGDKTLKLWDLDTGAVLRTLNGHSDSVTAVAVMPGGKHVLSASGDKTLKVWDLDTGAVLRTLEGHSDTVTALATVPGGNRALSASRDNTLKLWDLDAGEAITTFTGDHPIHACAFAPDARTVAAGDQNGHVHLLRLFEPPA